MDATALVPIVTAILELRASHPVRVGIDGCCAAGKTTLAEALAREIRAAGRTVIRASTDDFQNPSEVRWQLGPRSAEGFVRHQIDFGALRALLLEPLGPGGSLTFRTSSYDVHASRPNLSPEQHANPSDVLLLDGLFLHPPTLVDCFEQTILIDAPAELCIARALARNQERSTNAADLEAIYREKYLPGFALYCREAAPETKASFVIRC